MDVLAQLVLALWRGAVDFFVRALIGQNDPKGKKP
jgi:hypothetical protein